MTKKWLEFQAALVDGAWVSPYFVQLDAEGTICATARSLADAKAENQKGYLLPGVPNGHSHSFQYVMAGLAERVVAGRENDDFWFWREQMYRLANTIRPDELLEVTTRLYMSMLEYGYTSVTEFHYLNHDFGGKPFANPTEHGEIIMEAAKRSGIGLTLVPVYYNQAAPGVPLKEQQKRFSFASVESYLGFIEAMSRVQSARYPNARIGYGIHSLRAAPLEAIKEILSRRWTQGPCHLHASEQTADVDSFVSAYGSRPIRWLAENVPLGAEHNLVHATHLDEQERSLLARSGATVVLCPTTEANLGDGIFPLRAYQAEGGSWSIGTDSQVNLNPFVEMTALELTQRLLDRKRNVLCKPGAEISGDILFEAALQGGRRSVGITGPSFAVGAKFEGILIDPEHERLWERPLDAVLSILCYAPEKNHVKGTYSGGRLVAKNGIHEGKERRQDAYRNAITRLMGELKSL